MGLGTLQDLEHRISQVLARQEKICGEKEALAQRLRDQEVQMQEVLGQLRRYEVERDEIRGRLERILTGWESM